MLIIQGYYWDITKLESNESKNWWILAGDGFTVLLEGKGERGNENPGYS